MTGVNWTDFETTRTLADLSGRSLRTHVQELATRGINVLRIPLTVELIRNWMNGDESREVFTELVDACQELGVKIILAIEGVEQGSEAHLHPVWFTERFSTEDFVDAWLWLAEQHKGNDTIIAFDLKSQPHGWSGQSPDDSRIQPDPSVYACWGNPQGGDSGCSDQTNWPYVARTAAEQIHALHPDILIMVAGVENHESNQTPSSIPEFGRFWWGGNLSGVNEYTVNLSRQNKLLYSTRLKGPALEPDRGWFKNAAGEFDFTYTGLFNRKWKYAFGFILEEQLAPVFIGEWGSVTDTGDLNGQFTGLETQVAQNLLWLEAVTELLAIFDASHTWGTYGPNSEMVGGLVNDDWSEWDDVKLGILQSTLWKVDNEFVGLDHRVNLFNGTNVAKISGINPATDSPVIR